MTTDELIETGICEDMAEVLRVFPIDVLEDFAPTEDMHVGAEIRRQASTAAVAEPTCAPAFTARRRAGSTCKTGSRTAGVAFHGRSSLVVREVRS
jgi:hypothetical protein